MTMTVVSSEEVVPRDVLMALFPQPCQEDFWSAQLRMDGRVFHQCRETSLTSEILQHASSSSVAKMGRTTVVVGCSLLVGTPAALTPAEGQVSVNVRLSPCAGSDYVVGKTSEASVILSQWIQRMIHGSSMIQLSDLSIESGKYAWNLQVDVLCIDDDGNLKDTTMLALAAALKDFKLPVVEVNENEQQVVIVGPGKPLPLSHVPVSTTFGFIGSDMIICDPNKKEEACLKGTMTIVYTTEGILCGLDQQAGESGISVEKLKACMAMAKQRAREFAEQLTRKDS